MRILITPDSFKGTYSSPEVAAAVGTGVAAAGATPVPLPVADGGEGTFTALCQTLRAQIVEVPSRNPWGVPLTAGIGMTPDGTAIVELAQASGITVPHDGPRDPVAASTYGTGMLISAAVHYGARKILVAAGGSATTDGGAGAVQAIEDGGGLGDASIVVLSDVTTTFTDAAKIFGPQKGADPAMVELLTARLQEQAREFPQDPTGVARTGAAGGFSGGLWAHYGAELVSGADYILDAIAFDTRLREADAVVVGEGRLDSQTGEGKIIEAILRRVRRDERELPVIAIVGSVSEDLGAYAENFAQIIVATDDAAMARAGRTLVGTLQSWAASSPTAGGVTI
ncbi:glycerate kinase [Corynebacterium halotolerans]|uniref:Glycerate kinase n=1 Tax=Corynebacterium halotolerans YIM 70093 = DSM 44683 TaxID=1121362 RepID=M1MTY4_9CORY|nr:glycerate kinase [Corynebacterium halotolerans]AGF71164.1 glycerate kinase [Corynebacterium halotolerans YIM 70093 = DSM 44683]